MKIINKLLQSTTNYTMILGILDYRLSIEINILGEIISSSGVTVEKAHDQSLGNKK